MFRIVATEHTRPPKSGSLALLGSYDPHANAVRVNAEKLKTYLKHGAKISPTVHNLLIEHKVLEGKKVRAWKPKRVKQEEGGTKQGTTAPASSETPATESKPAEAAAEKPASAEATAGVPPAEEKKGATPSAESAETAS